VPDGTLQVNVTGGPAPTETQRLGIETAVRETIPEARAAQVEFVSADPALAPLDTSSDATVEATLRVMPPAHAPQRVTLPVALANVASQWADAQVLLVSNSPESIPFGKVLYNASLPNGRTTRLLYHHQNGSKTSRMTIEVALSNPAR
jgi:hypothetical protein